MLTCELTGNRYDQTWWPRIQPYVPSLRVEMFIIIICKFSVVYLIFSNNFAIVGAIRDTKCLIAIKQTMIQYFNLLGFRLVDRCCCLNVK